MTDFALPVAFHFGVAVDAATGTEDGAFQEVSGLEAEIELETVVEGGENRFVHRLPKPVRHPNLVLKRGVASEASALVAWCRDVFEKDFTTAIAPRGIVVSLRDAEGAPLRSWAVANAYPVKWSVAGFGATKNEVAIETMEFAYTTLKRSR
jgi:phage tail-like protein